MQRKNVIEAWVEWAVRKKNVVLFLVLALVVFGIFALTRINKNEFPTFQITQGLIAGIYPGADAAEVEQRLAIPLEQKLFSYKEIRRDAVSIVCRDGMCFIYADLTVSQRKKDEVWSKIKLGLADFKMTLPPEVLGVVVLDEFSNTSSMLIAMQSEDKSYSELQQYADHLCNRLRELPELAKATVLGSQSEEIAITLDRQKLSSYSIDPSQILLQLQSSTLKVPSGTFTTDYTSAPIRIETTISDERELSGRIVYSDPFGNVIRLSDIATIERRYKDPTSIITYNGHSCLVINVEMRDGENVVSFGKKIDKILDSFKNGIPTSVTLSRISDQPKVVETSVMSFLRDLLISMLVVIFVMLMLFPMRSALIASSGVPVCTAVSLALMYIVGIELNTVTLAALMVCLGMIVDDSIITMDGYMDRNLKGQHGIKAAASSARELFMPTFIATLAICLMFVPMLGILTGYLGDFVRAFPWVVLFSLMTSLFYAISMVPSMEIKYIKPIDPTQRKNLVSRTQDKFFSFMQRTYEKALDGCFRHPKITLAGGFAAVGLGILMFTQTNVQMMPDAARKNFVIELYLEQGSGLSTTRQRVDTLTNLLLSDPRIESVTAFTGEGAPRFNATYTPVLPSEQVSQIIVNTVSTKATQELLKELSYRYENIFPDAQIHFKRLDYSITPAPLEVSVCGEDREALYPVAEKIKEKMLSMNEDLTWVHSNADEVVPYVNVKLDEDQAARLGVSKALVSLSLGSSFSSQNLATLWEDGKRLPVNLYSEGIGKDMHYKTVGDQMVATALPGVNVPLRQIAEITPDWKHSQLERLNGTNVLCIYAELRPGRSQPPLKKVIKKYIDKEIVPTLPEGVSIQYGGLDVANNEVMPEVKWSFVAACAVLFLFLLLHFRKVSLALLTMVVSSLCLFGASFGLWIFNLEFTITAVLGLISLVGIIVRNGILMFEYAETAHFEKGLSIRDAAMEAGKRRMRPIFLTSCTTALGVLPMILSGDLLWMPMGVVICFGTMLSIFLIVLIMPICYWRIFDRKK